MFRSQKRWFTKVTWSVSSLVLLDYIAERYSHDLFRLNGMYQGLIGLTRYSWSSRDTSTYCIGIVNPIVYNTLDTCQPKSNFNYNVTKSKMWNQQVIYANIKNLNKCSDMECSFHHCICYRPNLYCGQPAQLSFWSFTLTGSWSHDALF